MPKLTTPSSRGLFFKSWDDQAVISTLSRGVWIPVKRGPWQPEVPRCPPHKCPDLRPCSQHTGRCGEWTARLRTPWVRSWSLLTDMTLNPKYPTHKVTHLHQYIPSSLLLYVLWKSCLTWRTSHRRCLRWWGPPPSWASLTSASSACEACPSLSPKRGQQWGQCVMEAGRWARCEAARWKLYQSYH